MKIAMTDMDIIWEEKEANKEECRIRVKEASLKQADIILFPEMTLTGFSMNLHHIKDEEEETVRFFSALAKEYRVAIGFGYATENRGRGYNHFCVVDQKGNVLEDYIKIHPFTYGGEAALFDGGTKICSMQLQEAVCGLFICYDLRFPEAFQQLPADTNVIFLIANWPQRRIEHWYALLQARAIEMQCYVVGINRTGEGGGLQYCKSSVAFRPDGVRLKEETDCRNRYVMLDFSWQKEYVTGFPTRIDRRPDSYHL